MMNNNNFNNNNPLEDNSTYNNQFNPALKAYQEMGSKISAGLLSSPPDWAKDTLYDMQRIRLKRINEKKKFFLTEIKYALDQASDVGMSTTVEHSTYYTIPLIGSVIGQSFQEIKNILSSETANGSVIFVQGTPGSGKSQLLKQIHLAIKSLEIRPPKPVLWSGIIDLFDGDLHSSRGIEQRLFKNWLDYSISRKNDLEEFSGSVDSPFDIFQDYQNQYSELQHIRFGLNNSLQDTEELLNARGSLLEKCFQQAVIALSDHYLPVICLDTAELFVQHSEDYLKDNSISSSEALNWLDKFLDSEASRTCVTIIAGRPSNINYIRDNTNISTDMIEFLSRRREPNKLYYYQLQNFDLSDTKSFILSRYSTSNGIDTDGESWDTLVEILKKRRVFSRDVDSNSACRKIHLLTQGKPLLLEWFYQLASSQVSEELGNVLTQNNDPSWIISEMARLTISSDSKFELKLNTSIAQEKIKQVLKYSCIAHQGLDANIISYLFEADDENDKRLDQLEAEEIVNALKLHPFFKVRNKFQVEFDNEIKLVERLFLHDEIYLALYPHVADHKSTMARQLERAYNYLAPSRESEYLFNKIFLDEYWWEDTKKVQQHLAIEYGVQDFLGEYLYYKLLADFRSGYDYYCYLSATALADHQVSFDKRLQNIFLSAIKQDVEVVFPYYQELESKVREVKRNLTFTSFKEEAIRTLIEIAETKKSKVTSARLLLCQTDALITIYDHTDWNQNGNKQHNLKKVVSLLLDIDAQVESTQVDEFSYVSWLKHFLLGKSYFYLGELAHKSHVLDEALEYYRLAISRYRAAAKNTTANLNNARRSLALLYVERGQRHIATELLELVLSTQKRLGHFISAALTESYLAVALSQSIRTCDAAYLLSEKALSTFEKVFKEEELQKLSDYYLIQLNRSITFNHRVLFQLSNENSILLYEGIIKKLEEANNYYTAVGNETLRLQSLNELGYALSIWSFKGQEQLGNTQNKRANGKLSNVYHNAINKALNYLVQVEDQCANNPKLWYERMKNLCDIAELKMHQNLYEVDLKNKAIFTETEVALAQIINSKDSSKRVYYNLFKSKIESLQANYYWSKYIDSEKQKLDHLVLYIVKVLSSFQNLLEFYQSVEVRIYLETEGDNSLGFPYIEKLAQDLAQNLNNTKERELAISIIKRLTAEGMKPSIDLFCLITDIDNSLISDKKLTDGEEYQVIEEVKEAIHRVVNIDNSHQPGHI